MSSFNKQLAPFVQQMKAAQLPAVVTANFSYYYHKLWQGQTGFIPENDIVPVTSLPDAQSLPHRMKDIGEKHMTKTVIIKLNGGLGTTMGMKGPKSLLKIKHSLSFLDIIIHQARSLDERMPVIFMNSFSTQNATRDTLARYSELKGEVPLDFLQHKIPKINAVDLSPVQWPENPQFEWCPPGHGDIYTALVTSGMLDRLLSAGYEYAFVSNADNLGAVADPCILGHFIDRKLSFMMEAADRTSADKKGGHLARQVKGGYVLREIAQCPEQDIAAFQDFHRHKYFNTNNIWIHLSSLKQVMARKKGVLGLPMIRNQKTLDPRNPESTPVIQLETAMGAAISLFDRADAIRVPRARFAPVKNTNDLLEVRSDCFTLNDHFHFIPNPKRKAKGLSIELDNGYYKRIDDFENRFPFGAPSLVECASLKVKGDFNFGSNVRLAGGVALLNSGRQTFFIKDNTVIQGELRV